MRDDLYISELQHRIQMLERQLSARPTNAQVEYVRDYGNRQKKLYEAVLARCVVLKRKLEEKGKAA
jgi:hypothetical protein